MNSEQNIPLLLLEIGTEEIPARFLPDALIRLREIAESNFQEYRLSFKSIMTFGTPRRLSLIANVNPLQEKAEKEIWGPPVNVAFDTEGMPTKTAEAFARAHNVRVDELVRKQKGKGTYVVAHIKEDSRNTKDLLPEVLPRIIQSLNFPKSMRWGNSNLRFVRPIHWILAIYNNSRIDFEIDGIKSSSTTRGHRYLSPATFEIKDGNSYINLLRNNFVILDTEERKKIILDNAKKLASSVNSFLIEDEELLQHVSFLIEYPCPVLGTFPDKYLSLPEELLITVMKDHQKYFALRDSNGRLVNYFIVVSNTLQENSETIKTGAEKVLKARFEDARFYYEEDNTVAPTDRLVGLKKVIYHDRLGSLYDKCQRISHIADFISNRCCPDRSSDIHTAALLSKTDLISGVVREFPELQGIMGSYYALNSGYNKNIAQALIEQYLPRHSGDILPSSDEGAVISLSDKLDNIASFFMLGLIPSGNEDPFALRRQVIGIISILIDRKYRVRTDELIETALQQLDVEDKEKIKNNILAFFEQRIEPFFLSQNYTLDSVLAVMPFVREKPLYTVKERLDAIKTFKKDADYESFLLAMKRINNIAPKSDIKPIDPKLFIQEEESALYRKVLSINPQIESFLDSDRYYDAINVLMTLKDEINRFFDKVLVMDKREDIKQNRLSLIKDIQIIGQKIADFSKLQ